MKKATLSACLSLVLAAGLCISGCDQEDAAGVALNDAHMQLASLNPAGTPPPTAKMKSDAYTKVINTLRTVSEKGNASQSAAAAVMVSQSQSGLAEPSATMAGEIERSVQTQLSSVRSLFSQYVTISARARAQASYDPSRELAEIDKSDKAKVEETKAEQTRKSALEKQVADLRTQARAKADQARELNQRAGAMHQQAVNQTATQAEQTLIQARDLSRQAAAIEVESAGLEAEAKKIEPQGVAIESAIDRLNKQRDLLAKERGAVAKRAQNSKDDASRLRAEAAKIADEIKTAIDQVDALRGGDLRAQIDDAVKNYNASISSAKKAVQEMRAAANVAIGNSQQALGDVYFAQAQGSVAYSVALQSLASGADALPDSAKYKASADSASAAAKEAFEQAHQAYAAADAAYRASGGGEEAKTRLASLTRKFRDLVKATGGSGEAFPETEAPAETPAAPAEAPAGSASADTPAAVLAAFLDPNGAPQSKTSLIYAAGDSERQMVGSFIEMMEKGKRLSEALKAKFGGDMNELGGQFSQMAGGLDPTKLAAVKASDIQVTENGDSAEGRIAGLPNSWKLRKADGKWQIEFASIMPVPPEQMPMVAAMLPGLGKVMDDMTAEVAAGKYADQQAFMQAFMQKMMQSATRPGGG